MDECDNVPYLMIGSMAIGAVALAFTNYFVAGALTLGGVALSQKKQNNAIAPTAMLPIIKYGTLSHSSIACRTAVSFQS